MLETNTYATISHFRYFDVFGLRNDPFEDCKQWKLLKHIPLSDLNPATERVGWGRVANCLPAQFLMYPSIFASRCVFCKVEVISFSKHPTFWKSVSKIKFYVDFPKKNIFGNFWKMRISKISENFSRKVDFPPKSEKSIFQNHFQHFRFFSKIVQKFSKFSVFQKFRKNIFFGKSM